MFKDNIKAYWTLLKGVATVTRVMIFEKFTGLFMLLYFLMALSFSLLAGVVHWGIGLGMLILWFALYPQVTKNSQFLKRILIRKNDRIEYADPDEQEGKEIFKKAVVVLKMKPAEVEKTKLISQELMHDNTHFYLVTQDKDAKVIAFDWIIGLSPEFLEISFDEED